MPIYWIWLTKLKGLSVPERLWLLQNFADPEEIYLAEPKLLPGGIGNALEDKDLTQTQVAQFLGMSQTGYSKYETGENDIPTAILLKLADFYQTTTDYLLGRTDEK